MKHRDIQRLYKNHIFLLCRNEGTVKTLSGDVVTVVFFVNDAESSWTQFDKLKYKTEHENALRFIVSSARQKGVRLKMRVAYVETTVDEKCTQFNYKDWSDKIIKKHNFSTLNDFQNGYKSHYKCDEAPVMFVYNKKLRCCALSSDASTRAYGEFSMLSSSDKSGSIIHELLHQFGAADFYYIDEITQLMRDKYYNSIMGSVQDRHIDSLTAYIIGWTDEINSTAVEILEKTKHLTKQDLADRIDREWKKRR